MTEYDLWQVYLAEMKRAARADRLERDIRGALELLAEDRYHSDLAAIDILRAALEDEDD